MTFYKSTRNINGVAMKVTSDVNAEDVLEYENFVISEAALAALTERLGGSNNASIQCDIKPVLSEKSNDLREAEGKYTFVVKRDATKDDVRRQLQSFGMPKLKRFRRLWFVEKLSVAE